MKQRDNKRQVKIRRGRHGNNASRAKTYSLILICGLLIVSGIFFAGRMHFSSMDYGMKNSRLRKQVDELEAEKRRLLLAREVSLSPNEIKKAAMRSGLTDPAATAGLMAQVASATKEKALPNTGSEAKPLIIKTGAVAPSPSLNRIDAVFSKTEKMGKQAKKLNPIN